MIFYLLLVYMVVALATMLYMPIVRAQTAHKVRHHLKQERLELMTEQERKVLLYSLQGIEAPLSTWVLVMAGLMWPTQVVAYIGASIWGVFFDRRVRRAEADVVCSCPGCGQNLACGHDVGVTPVPDTKILRFGCGQCGWLSEWDLEPPVPVMLRTIKPGARDFSPENKTDDRASG